MSARVLCLLAPGFEEVEMVTPVDLLRRAGVEVVVAAIGDNKSVEGRSGLCIQADVLLSEVSTAGYDLLFLPGGPGVKELRVDGRPAGLAKSFYDDGKFVAAICAAPTILKDAGLLTGRRFTAHFSVRPELETALDERVVVDGQLITARGAGTALDFGLELVRSLAGHDKAQEIADSIMA